MEWLRITERKSKAHMSWKRLDVSSDAVARGTAQTLKHAFEGIFDASGCPRNAALFEVAGPDGLQLFFSPGAAELFEANLKTMPQRSAGTPGPSATLVVGDPATWSRG